MKNTVVLICLIVIVGCNRQGYAPPSSPSKGPWPWKASTERIEELREGFGKLELGQEHETVLRLMGKPDSVKPMVRKETGTRIGTFYDYYVERFDASPTAGDRQITLALDLDGKLKKIGVSNIDWAGADNKTIVIPGN